MLRDRTIRQSQTIVPFGVGGIYDFLGESLVACDISFWKDMGEPIACPRLAKNLNVTEFRAAPSRPPLQWGGGPAVPYRRFPQWLFCPVCRVTTHWRSMMEKDGQPPRCGACRRGPQLVPMRFVIACSDGHLGDLPWDFWAHWGTTQPSQRQCHARDLVFTSRPGGGTGLETLEVRCRTCGAARTLAGITGKDSLKPLGVKCPGKQPWQRSEHAQQCVEQPQVLQRGASNLYFAATRSAIDIPPESRFEVYSDLALLIGATPEFRVIMSAPNGPMADPLKQALADQFQCPLDRVTALVQQEIRKREGAGTVHKETIKDLESEEWHAFLTPLEEYDDRDRFITRHVPLVRDEDLAVAGPTLERLRSLIDRVVIATRLREIRALVGFSRYSPDSNQVAPDLGRGLDWLPAIEVFGEGVFFTLREEALQAWENSVAVAERAVILEGRRARSLFAGRLKRASPRFVLLHTLAHVLIRELSFQCGYATSSLRERIYCKLPDDGSPQAGILVYTAAGDMEGTLGGLARRGEPPLLLQSIMAALERAAWCSTDPICIESTGQGFNSLNLGACHACSLLPETSCVYANALLDRAFLLGGTLALRGYFSEVLALARQSAAAAGLR